jgi:hypothetical protein
VVAGFASALSDGDRVTYSRATVFARGARIYNGRPVAPCDQPRGHGLRRPGQGASERYADRRGLGSPDLA